MLLQFSYVLAVPYDFEQVFITNKVEPKKKRKLAILMNKKGYSEMQSDKHLVPLNRIFLCGLSSEATEDYICQLMGAVPLGCSRGSEGKQGSHQLC